ncbi:MAG: sensor histidine kinase [Leptolyngbyaceae cyanobacterium]
MAYDVRNLLSILKPRINYLKSIRILYFSRNMLPLSSQKSNTANDNLAVKETQYWEVKHFRHWSLGSKILVAYGISFLVALTGIMTGFSVSRQIENEALSLQEEALKDREKAANLQEDLLEFLLYQKSISKDLEDFRRSGIRSVSFQTNLSEFLVEYDEFKQSWQAFRTNDELTGDDAIDAAGLPEAQRVAGAIVRDYEAAINDYIRQTDWHFPGLKPTAVTPDQIALLQSKLATLNQSEFNLKVGDFTERISTLVDATEEQYGKATELLQRSSIMQTRLMLVSALASGLLGSLLMLTLSYLLLRPLKEMMAMTQQSIENADFDLYVQTKSQDELGKLAQAFNTYLQFVKQLLMQRETANQKLQGTLDELHRTQAQMLQNEKMSGLGQLVAGVAHEINNPVSFIHGNIIHVQGYAEDLLELVSLYQKYYPNPVDEIRVEEQKIDLEFLQRDLPKTLLSMQMGSDRIREIVLSLRSFSRVDEAEFKPVDIHAGLDSTLVILNHRLKARPDCSEISVVKEYGALPEIECYPGLLNQVFMNILSNAIDALEGWVKGQTGDKREKNTGKITIRTTLLDQSWVQIAIRDNGPGMTPEVQQRIFEPFFTTKPVGKGTGMGMSISYQIVTDRHNGKLECSSNLGEGTEFTIQIPLKQAAMKL